ncbi:MAG: bifunctional glutamate N-acetyltransferase/amino-acid acetyltransferase ArgJ [Candidatus Methylomirabilales bacterium]
MSEPIRTVPGGITAPRGVRAAGVAAGIKKSGPDLALIVPRIASPVAGLFTTNQVKAPPVLLCQEHLRGGRLAAIVANSGNANCCTGQAGMDDARAMAAAAARALGVSAAEVFVCSTGVIGTRLPMEKVRAGTVEAAARLDETGGEAAAHAILTTDTRAKEAADEFLLGGAPIRVGGIAKGSGMIGPRMATMLAFLATDATIEAPHLQEILGRVVDRSFNCVTVDGDTSTNDTVLCFATGASGTPPLRPGSDGARLFECALSQVATALARAIAQDGEGATKLVSVHVKGARTREAAHAFALRVANSPLVKTACYAQDCNWGRIMAALGSAGIPLRPEEISINIAEVPVVRKGVGLGPEAEAQAGAAMAAPEFSLEIDFGGGGGEAVAWTCDLTEDYVRINVGYRS